MFSMITNIVTALTEHKGRYQRSTEEIEERSFLRHLKEAVSRPSF